MANSATEIADQALGLLGDRNTGGLDSGSTLANVCNKYFQNAVDDVLKRVKPDTAQEESSLPQLTFTSGDHQLAYRYQLPEDPFCLKVIAANGKPWHISGNRLIGRQISSNDDTMFIRYVARVKNYGLLSSEVVQCISYKLAIAIAQNLQRADSDRKRLFDEYEAVILPRALGEEGENQSVEDDITHESSWENARFSRNDDYDRDYTSN